MKQRFRDCAKKKRELERETGRAVTYEVADRHTAEIMPGDYATCDLWNVLQGGHKKQAGP